MINSLSTLDEKIFCLCLQETQNEKIIAANKMVRKGQHLSTYN